MIRRIVFDFDGTLADTFQQTVNLIKKIRPDLSQKEIDIYRELGAREAKKEFKVSLREIFKIIKIIKKEQLNIIEKTEVFGGIKETIRELRKRKIEVGILSSNSKENIEKWLDKKGMVVDWIRSESTIFGKEKALIKVKSDDMIYVGDEVRDVEACHKIEMKIVAVAWGYNSKNALLKSNPDYLVETSRELRNLLLTLSQ